MTEAERKAREKELESACSAASIHWKRAAARKDWDQVRADLDVYKFSGEIVKTDPRRTEAYKDKVIEGLGLGDDVKAKHPELKPADVAAAREVYRRKAAAMWLDGSPYTSTYRLPPMHQTNLVAEDAH